MSNTAARGRRTVQGLAGARLGVAWARGGAGGRWLGTAFLHGAGGGERGVRACDGWDSCGQLGLAQQDDIMQTAASASLLPVGQW